MNTKKHLGILGGGPSALFLFKQLVDGKCTKAVVTIFERGRQLGSGMPYSTAGANDEHITNVSGNEIPPLVTTVAEWIKTAPKQLLDHFEITPESYNDYKVLPRLLFGQYLSAQFALLQQQAAGIGLEALVRFNSEVTDIIDEPDNGKITVEVNGDEHYQFDTVVTSTGHNWPDEHEGKIPRYFDSPYPPAKLRIKANHAVAVKGTSLTAVDALRTLARSNGDFTIEKDGKRIFHLAEDSPDFKVVLHSRHGLLPAVRFHLEDTHLKNKKLLTKEQIAAHIKENNGFLSLDYIFEKDFKDIFRDKDPELYARLKNMRVEDFVDEVMGTREERNAFRLLAAEYEEAERSIKTRTSVYWKELLGALSFAMNYPAKYFSAEDMERLQKSLLPLISVVIAYMPQSSCEEMMAMHQAGVLDVVAVGEDSEVEPLKNGGAVYRYTDEEGKKQEKHFETFVDASGQPHLSYNNLPYKSLTENKTVSPALLQYRDAEKGKAAKVEGKDVVTDEQGNYHLKVPGIAIDDNFRVINEQGDANPRLYMMAVPYIGGYNPDYSGLDFCEEASKRIMQTLFEEV
ncbi:FAD/NAD(P)-binding protein [Mucilaginibacter pedocola]|uniref:FAD-dependent urate hydroxylase HpyO/Asp monooxygenase CreE-like FAD/NAD(P)-binding domain-containing protein n=1 Tax=Mucilaginibacter pedocola TaxID=1792845 RepID=A0A1S9P640_9SPHI|nr:FAD/NAD(P)-binding protein [Mucilaginibacter pedocola]OOQ56405.1 hypothetical protein BC343_18310 [Mucilaginibacter pedocola]